MEDFNILFERDGFYYINFALLKYYLSWLLSFGIPLNFISKVTASLSSLKSCVRRITRLYAALAICCCRGS